jgi:hypothetical protein
MIKKIIIFVLCSFTQTMLPLMLNGIIETGVSKNNFLCPTSTSSAVPCIDANQRYSNTVLVDGQILQIFNSQAYWVHEQANAEQYDTQVLAYTGSELEAKLQAQGWTAMGGYCILISTNSILTQIVKPELVAQKNQKKIVAQLWYNGDRLLQLWSQDATVVDADASITLEISNAVDPLTEVKNLKQGTSLKDTFLYALPLQPANRDETMYQSASACPRSIKIQ